MQRTPLYGLGVDSSEEVGADSVRMGAGRQTPSKACSDFCPNSVWKTSEASGVAITTVRHRTFYLDSGEMEPRTINSCSNQLFSLNFIYVALEIPIDLI